MTFHKFSYMVAVTTPDDNGAAVTIDTDVYLPAARPPRSGYPLMLVFHGGASRKDNPFDATHAQAFAKHGYASLIYSQRGHGQSGGLVNVAGPQEMRDLFDVLAWAFKIRGRGSKPAHPAFRLDRRRIGLQGYSQGGLHVNLGQVWHASKLYDPYGFRFRVLEPGNTPDMVMQALVPNQVFKFTWAEGLFGTYSSTGKLGSAFKRWIVQAAADAPLYDRPRCDASRHDTPTSTIEQDLAFRSPGCFVSRMTLPSLWAQSFDDGLFPPELAISMWRRMSDRRDNRLYLSMGGHGAPQADPAAEDDRLRSQIKFADHFLRGRPLRMPRVVYWTRDPAVVVSANKYSYPAGAWYRQTSGQWPPRGIRVRTYRLAANGTAVEGASAPAGSLPLTPLSSDESNDPVALTAVSSTPIGTSPVRALPATGFPGLVASFITAPLSSDLELSGPAVGHLRWSPNSSNTQLVTKLFDRAPDGTMTLMTRGVTGLRAAAIGAPRNVIVAGSDTSFLLRRGHRVVIWVMSGDVPYYRQYGDSGGGVLSEGSVSTLSLPLRLSSR